MPTYWIENEAKIWGQHWHGYGKTTITGTVCVKYVEKLVYLVLKIIYSPLKSWKESVFVSTKKLSYFDRFDSISFSASASTNKANKTLGFIKRNIHGCTQKVKQHTFTTMVRPTLEYASTYWDPHSKDLIEDISRTSAKKSSTFCLQ